MGYTTNTLSVEDYGGEVGSVSFYTADLTSVNFAAVNASIDALTAAIQPVILGKIRHKRTTSTDLIDGSAVTDMAAQRENKWFVAMTDTTEYLDIANTIANPGYLRKFSMEIPTAELATHLIAGTEIGNLVDNAEMIALRDAVEATVRSAWSYMKAAPTTRVDSIKFVARNT